MRRVPRLGSCVVVLAIAGCATSRRPLQPVPGSDLARPERPVEQLVREMMQCDTVRALPTAGSGRAGDRCMRVASDTLAHPGGPAKVP